MLEDCGILITGGSGAFGTAFVRHLLQMEKGPKRIVVYSRGEHRQFLMSKELYKLDKGQLRYFIGDVRDRDRLRRGLEGIDVIIHAAALKRIEVGRYNPIEVKKTNIDGAVSVIEAAHDAGVQKVVFLSSDKAYQPISPYGLSKAMAECLFLASNSTTGWHGPRFSICRYGNVWNSTGSVVPIWKRALETGQETQITDPDCTRFFMRMQEAVELVLKAIESNDTMHVPILPAYRLGDLAEAMGVKPTVIGLPEWEKKHESMADGNCSENARRMTVAELRQELRNGTLKSSVEMVIPLMRKIPMSIQTENELVESASEHQLENINRGKKASETIEKIEHVRQTNNRFWCEIISIAVKWAPKETKKVLKTIEENDRKISELMRCLQEQLPD